MKDTTGAKKVAPKYGRIKLHYPSIAEAWQQAEGWKASGDVLPVRDLGFPNGATLADGTPITGVRLMPWAADNATKHGASDNRPCAIHLLEPGTGKPTGKIIALLPSGELHAEAAYNALLHAMQTKEGEVFTGTVGDDLPTVGWYALYSLVDDLSEPYPLSDDFTDFTKLVDYAMVKSGVAAAGELFAVYLSLSDVEKDRVYHFTMDAKGRDENEASFNYAPIETFMGFLEEIATNKSVEQVCQLMEMTRLEYDLLSWKWETLQSVDAAIANRVRERYTTS